jgi:hypothetical protein
MSNTFTNKKAKDIAFKNFGHTLDCVLGYSDSGYSIKDEADSFDQNFEEDITELGVTPTDGRIKMVRDYYKKMVSDFEKFVRNKYSFYDKKTKP